MVVSRIDEALKRKGFGKTAADAGGGQGVFVSPWEELRESSGTQAPAPPVPILAPPDGSSALSLSRAWRERLAIAPEANPMLVEQFRRLAATLHHAQSHNGIRVIMLTSASPDEGKTLTAVNLALVLSESYRKRVLLIDADLRRPSLSNVADLTSGSGLSEALKSTTEQKLGVLQITPTLMFLAGGRPDPDPMSALTSVRMKHILEEAAGRFDWVILDAPPMGPMPDASLLSHMVDGAVFVIRAGRSQYPSVQKAIEALGRERILGVVLNGVENMPAEQYEYPSRGDAR